MFAGGKSASLRGAVRGAPSGLRKQLAWNAASHGGKVRLLSGGRGTCPKALARVAETRCPGPGGLDAVRASPPNGRSSIACPARRRFWSCALVGTHYRFATGASSPVGRTLLGLKRAGEH